MIGAIVATIFSSIVGAFIVCSIVDALNCDFEQFNNYGNRSTAKITFDEFLLFCEVNKRNLSYGTAYIFFDDGKKRIGLQFTTRKEYNKYIKWLKAQQKQEKTQKENSNREYIIQSTLEKAQALKAKADREKERANQEVNSVINLQKDLFKYANKKNKED